MDRKPQMDAFGATSLVVFAALLGFNQVVIKVVNAGLQPVFFCALRSALAVLCVALWMRLRGLPLRPAPGTSRAGILIGLVFSTEFLLLFLALDLTTVARSAVIFYSMPVWLAIAGHFLLPGERITPPKAAGLALAMGGVAVAILSRAPGGAGSLAGDLCALGAALGWAGIPLVARITPLSRERPEMQLMWQVAVSAPVLMLLAPFFGPLIREVQPIHLWGLGFQAAVIVSAGFIFWMWLISVYPAASVASFSFLSPVFGVGFGWWLLDEPVGPALLSALGLVAAGLVLINRRPRMARPA